MNDDILVAMNGIPIITRDDLEREKEKICDNNPKLKEALPLMNPKEVDRNFLEGLVYQKIVDEYIKIHKLDESAVYAAELKRCKGEEKLVNTHIFWNRFTVMVDEAEIRQFYEENKDKYFRALSDQMILDKSEYVSYENVQEKIKEILGQEKRRDLVDQEIEKLKDMYKIEVNEEFFK